MVGCTSLFSAKAVCFSVLPVDSAQAADEWPVRGTSRVMGQGCVSNTARLNFPSHVCVYLSTVHSPLEETEKKTRCSSMGVGWEGERQKAWKRPPNLQLSPWWNADCTFNQLRQKSFLQMQSEVRGNVRCTASLPKPHLPLSHLALRKLSIMAYGRFKWSHSLDNVHENMVAQVVDKSTWLSQRLAGQVSTPSTVISLLGINNSS